jgi:hypothetical protein
MEQIVFVHDLFLNFDDDDRAGALSKVFEVGPRK